MLQPLFRAELKADEILTAVLAAENEIWDPVSEIISNLLKEMLKNGSYQIKTGKQSPNGKFQKSLEENKWQIVLLALITMPS